MKLFATLLAASAVVVTAAAPSAQAQIVDFADRVFINDPVETNDSRGDNRGNTTDYSGNRNNDNSRVDTTVDSNGVLGNRNRVVSTDGNRNTINTGNVGTLAGAEEGAVTATGGKGGKGGKGGSASATGGSGGAGGSSSSQARGGDQSQGQSQSNRSTNSNSNSTSSSSRNRNNTRSSSNANNNGNSQTLNYTNIDIPEATVAPLPENGVPGQIGDVVIPLPSITGGVFTTRDNDIFYGGDRSTTGATIGFQIPLGTGQVVAAAEQVVARRESAQRFRLIQEATWMLQQGVLSAEAHPEHWAALYGAPSVAPLF